MYDSQEIAKEAALKNGEEEIIFASLGYLTNKDSDNLSLMSGDTNWQFFAQRVEVDAPLEEIKPNTGDQTRINLFIGLLGVTGFYMIYRMTKKDKNISQS